MQKIFLRALVLTVLFISAFVVAEAQATRTWVSGVGDDVNPCSRTAPCKTFAGAISKTAVNGEINCLDPAGFGAITITKSITIDCEDTQGSILAALVNGVIINIANPAPADKKTVILRGLSINGVGTGINGVKIISAAKVFIEKTVLDGFTQSGVSVENASPVQVFIGECSIRNNTVRGVGTLSTAASDITLTRTTIAGNGTGIAAAANSTVRLSANSIVYNTTGLAASSGGKIVSTRDNLIDGNGTNGAATSNIALQ